MHENTRGFASKPLFLCYAYEAMARAESVSGNPAKVKEHLGAATRLAEDVPKDEDRRLLVNDLQSIE